MSCFCHGRTRWLRGLPGGINIAFELHRNLSEAVCFCDKCNLHGCDVSFEISLEVAVSSIRLFFVCNCQDALQDLQKAAELMPQEWTLFGFCCSQAELTSGWQPSAHSVNSVAFCCSIIFLYSWSTLVDSGRLGSRTIQDRGIRAEIQTVQHDLRAHREANRYRLANWANLSVLDQESEFSRLRKAATLEASSMWQNFLGCVDFSSNCSRRRRTCLWRCSSLQTEFKDSQRGECEKYISTFFQLEWSRVHACITRLVLGHIQFYSEGHTLTCRAKSSDTRPQSARSLPWFKGGPLEVQHGWWVHSTSASDLEIIGLWMLLVTLSTWRRQAVMASKIFRSCEDFGCFTIVQSFSPVGLLAQVCQQLPLSQRLLFVSSNWQGKRESPGKWHRHSIIVVCGLAMLERDFTWSWAARPTKGGKLVMCVGGESRRSDPFLNAYPVLDSHAQAYDSGRRAKKSLESQSSAA